MDTIYNANYMKVESATRSLLISHQQLEIICQLLEDEFKRGLHRETNPIANVKMYPTHIRDQPSKYEVLGHFAEPEEGRILALDLGGTNFRVILVELDDGQFHMDNETYSLSTDIMHGPGAQLFDYIADCLHKFVTQHKLAGIRLPLGFTFSFPIQQEGLAHARLVNWTKGFKCSGVEGRDVVELLREAIDRRIDLDIDVVAVVNDTTGTLIACAYQNRECRVGLIVGTGTNACYMEKIDNVHCMEASDDLLTTDEEDNAADNHNHTAAIHQNGNSKGNSHSNTNGVSQNSNGDTHYADIWKKRHGRKQTTVVNTEWGAFGDNGILDFVRTNWDNEIDINSVNTSKQKFEKMISGLYIGELCRRIMVDMALEERVLFAPICHYSNNNQNNKHNIIKSNENKDIINHTSNNKGNNNTNKCKVNYINHNVTTSCNGNGILSSSNNNNHQQHPQQQQQQQQQQQHILCFADAEKVRQRERLLIEGKFTKPFAFETKYVSMVESDPVDVFDNTRRALKEAYDIDWASDQDCASVKLICSRVSTRAAHLVSAAVACLLNKMARPHTVVGVDGSMFKYHPHFHSIMAKKTKELTHPEYRFQLMFSEDGSGRGAAIVASVACKQRRISKEISRERQMKASLVQPS